jgi:hypothetical protein
MRTSDIIRYLLELSVDTRNMSAAAAAHLLVNSLEVDRMFIIVFVASFFIANYF